MEGALAALREATAPARHALASSPLARRVVSREVTLDDYRTWLRIQFALFVPWSEAYPQRLRRACRCDPSVRLDALHLDRAALYGGVLDEPALGDFRFDWNDDSPAWWGALYVFEGPRRDARAVAQHLRQQLGLCVSGALHFLDPANEGMQPAWSSVAQALERGLPQYSRPAAIEGALTVLGNFHTAFARAAADGGDAGAVAA